MWGKGGWFGWIISNGYARVGGRKCLQLSRNAHSCGNQENTYWRYWTYCKSTHWNGGNFCFWKASACPQMQLWQENSEKAENCRFWIFSGQVNGAVRMLWTQGEIQNCLKNDYSSFYKHVHRWSYLQIQLQLWNWYKLFSLIGAGWDGWSNINKPLSFPPPHSRVYILPPSPLLLAAPPVWSDDLASRCRSGTFSRIKLALYMEAHTVPGTAR